MTLTKQHLRGSIWFLSFGLSLIGCGPSKGSVKGEPGTVAKDAKIQVDKGSMPGPSPSKKVIVGKDGAPTGAGEPGKK